MIAEELAKILKREIAEAVRKAVEAENEKYIGTAEAAKMLGVTAKTIHNRISEIPHYNIGNRLRFRESDIRRLVTGE